ncbi:hypothetical protein [Paenibacillus xylanilyticus]|uniref:hypothetical protein n=1 Tax=Paenibacillus xylanilyticus TaxID=248903 RepID=UPI0039A1161F
MTSYESIKSSIALDFKEYMEQEGLNVSQVSAKTLEEDWRVVNDSSFTRTLYIITIALESLKYKEIADFIHARLDRYTRNMTFGEHIDNNDIEKLLQDIETCKLLINRTDKYKIRETTNSTKSRVEYILGLSVD